LGAFFGLSLRFCSALKIPLNHAGMGQRKKGKKKGKKKGWKARQGKGLSLFCRNVDNFFE
jgi:hypothetical protein